MQARILAASLPLIAILALSTGAAAQQRVSSGEAEQRTSVQGPYQLQAAPPAARQSGQSAPAPRDPEQPICAHCGSDVQAQPAGAGADFFIRLPGVEGESSPPPPPPPPPPQNAPREQISLNYEEPKASSESAGANIAAPQDGQAALIVPAVQRVREAAAAPDDENIVPELPICGHCAADVAPTQPAAQAAPAERPRRRFSFSIGGVTLSSGGGVSVAVGDIDGDSGGGARSEPSNSRPSSARPTPVRPR